MTIKLNFQVVAFKMCFVGVLFYVLVSRVSLVKRIGTMHGRVKCVVEYQNAIVFLVLIVRINVTKKLALSVTRSGSSTKKISHVIPE